MSRQPEPRQPVSVDRRTFLSMLGVSGAAVATAVNPLSAIGADAATQAQKATKSTAKKATAAKTSTGNAVLGGTGGAAAVDQRVLVVIELQGGNDGFSMLIPASDGRFRSLRDRVWIDGKNSSPMADGYAITAGLAPLGNQLAFVEGVGVAKPDLSHSSMMARWWAGDPDGSAALRTGFLGRCCDLFGDSAPIAGVSIGGGSTPALVSERAATVSLPNLGSLGELTKDQDERMRPTLSSLTDGGGDVDGLESVNPELMARARAGLSNGMGIVNRLGGVSGKKPGYPDGRLGESLALARELVTLNAGIRVVHVPWGSFDTHTGHAWSHPDQMRQLGTALTAFHNDLVRSGVRQRVLVATTSEFGRRPQANANGTDHGTASTALLFGPVRAGRHGVAPNFNQLDGAGNVAATVEMTDYYATLAAWLGLPPSTALGRAGTPIASVGV
jgi:uncharacterized protein (DUF1501 family)